MSGEIDKILKWARRYGLALCCVIVPVALALGPFVVLSWLAPPPHDNVPKIELYKPPKPEPNASNRSGDKSTSNSVAAAVNGPTTSNQSSAAPQESLDAALFLIGRYYSGAMRYIAGSAFIYLVSLAMLIFSSVIVYQRSNLKCLLALFAFVLSLDGFTCAFSTYYEHPLLYGRELVVDYVLSAAVACKALMTITTLMVVRLISINIFVGLLAVGMLLMALAVLSIRGGSSKLDRTELEVRTELRLRRNWLRIALGLGSALFVTSVLANRALVGWTLSLVSVPQKGALQPLADAITLQLGTIGTIAIIAAFAPAITAWWLDKELYRDKFLKKAASGKAKSEPERKPHDAAEPQEKDAQSSEPKASDEFSFAPLATISAIIAALAPLLASPFINTLISLFHGVEK